MSITRKEYEDARHVVAEYERLEKLSEKSDKELRKQNYFTRVYLALLQETYDGVAVDVTDGFGYSYSTVYVREPRKLLHIDEANIPNDKLAVIRTLYQELYPNTDEDIEP